jgi:3-oxoadipate enol-lactonase
MSDTPTPTTGFCPVEGGALYYQVAGNGPALLFIHAGVADHRMWDDQVAAFANDHRVICYDTRDFGQTTTENVPFSNRQDIVDLLNYLNVSRTAVVGCSRGGQIALDFTLEHPEMVTALVSVAGGISGLDEASAIQAGFAPPTPTEMALESALEAAETAKDYPTLIDLELQMWIDGPDQPPTRVAPEMRAKVRTMIAESYERHRDEQATPRPLDPPAFRRLNEIHVPTLTIYGDLDESIAATAMTYLAQHIAGARVVLMPGTAHLPNMEQPERFNAILRDFLTQAGA